MFNSRDRHDHPLDWTTLRSAEMKKQKSFFLPFFAKK
jgi:hypothetical protein